MNVVKPSGALSLILCITAAIILALLLVVLILGAYLVTQTPQFKGLVGAQVLEPPEPQVRKPVIKQIKPTTPSYNNFVVELV